MQYIVQVVLYICEFFVRSVNILTDPVFADKAEDVMFLPFIRIFSTLRGIQLSLRYSKLPVLRNKEQKSYNKLGSSMSL